MGSTGTLLQYFLMVLLRRIKFNLEPLFSSSFLSKSIWKVATYLANKDVSKNKYHGFIGRYLYLAAKLISGGHMRSISQKRIQDIRAITEWEALTAKATAKNI